MEAVHVFLGQDGRVNHGRIDVPRERSLDEDTVAVRISIQAGDKQQQFLLGRRLGKHRGVGKNSQLPRLLFLHAHIHLGGRIFSNPNEGQARLDAPMLHGRDPDQRLLVDVGSDGPTVDEIVHGICWTDTWPLSGQCRAALGNINEPEILRWIARAGGPGCDCQD